MNTRKKLKFAVPLVILAGLIVLATLCLVDVRLGILACAAPLLLGIVLPEGEFQSTVIKGIESQRDATLKLETKLGEQEKRFIGVEGDIGTLKTNANSTAAQFAQLKKELQRTSSPRREGFVSDDCARYLGALVAAHGIVQNKVRDGRDRLADICKDILGIEVKSALTSSDIPLPTDYAAQVVELVATYGKARQYGTVYPLGAGSVKLPYLKTDTTFGLLAQSTTVTAVSPQTDWVTFTVEKFGGMVQMPSEIDEDSIFAMGQFLARYGARNVARCEDYQFFRSSGAGSGANGSVKGLCVLQNAANNAKHQYLGTGSTNGKTAYSDMTLSDCRAVRTVIDAPALARAAYFFHPSFEQKLASYNTSATVTPYRFTGTSAQGATLDGFPVVFVDVLPTYTATPSVSTGFALFGDLSYHYLGVRGGPRIDSSAVAGFTTDDIYVRMMERFTTGLMATGAVAVLETDAS